MGWAVSLTGFGELTPISRPGGQGRVYRPKATPAGLSADPVVLKLYRRYPPAAAEQVLAAMIAWSHSLSDEQRSLLRQSTAWPMAVVRAGDAPVGIAMRDVSGRFAVPFTMPSGRRERVLLALEHLLGDDGYLQARGAGPALDTLTRTRVAERISRVLAFLHRHGIAASDIAPSNVLVFLDRSQAQVCLIDCDSMVFAGAQALACVETADWQLPREFAEPALTRAADAYKLGLVVLRLYARCHDARDLAPHAAHVPAAVRALLARALSADARNRPTSGEWQRELSQVAADPYLNARYPGPAPTRPPPRAVRTSPRLVSAPLRARGHASAARPASSWTPPRARPSPSSRSQGAAPALISAPSWRPPRRAAATGLRRTVALLWMVAGISLLFLLLSHLFASAASAGIGSGGAVVQNAAPGVTYYVVPGSSGSGAPWRYTYGQGAPLP